MWQPSFCLRLCLNESALCYRIKRCACLSYQESISSVNVLTFQIGAVFFSNPTVRLLLVLADLLLQMDELTLRVMNWIACSTMRVSAIHGEANSWSLASNHADFGNSLRVVWLALSIFSMKIPYPSVGSATITWVTAPTSLPSWMMGLPDTSVVNKGQDFDKIFSFYFCL